MNKFSLAALMCAFCLGGAHAEQFVRIVQAEGSAATGSGGDPITTVNNPVITPGGDIAFTVTITRGSGTEQGIFVNNQVAFLNSSVASPVLTGAESTMGIGNGDFIYSPSINGGDGVYSRLAGAILADDDPIPPMTGVLQHFQLKTDNDVH